MMCGHRCARRCVWPRDAAGGRRLSAGERGRGLPRRVGPGDAGWAGCCLVLLLGVGAGVVRADQVVTGDANHPRVRVTGYERGRLVYRLPGGGVESTPVRDVQLIIIDTMAGFADFNDAEALVRQGTLREGIGRYDRARRHSEGFWSDLVTSRLLIACDRAGAIDKAVLNFIRVLEGRWSGPAAAAMLMPRFTVRDGDGPDGRVVARAVEMLDAASARTHDPSAAALLTLVRYALYRDTGDARAGAMTRAVAALVIPKAAGSDRAYAIQAAAIAAVLSSATDGGPAPAVEDAMASLDRAIEACPDNVVADVLLLKGRTLLARARTREDVIRSSWPFMRVVIHMPSDPRVPRALVGAAEALERIDRRDKALDLLRACLAHPLLSDDTRALAEAAIGRLTADAPGK